MRKAVLVAIVVGAMAFSTTAGAETRAGDAHMTMPNTTGLSAWGILGYAGSLGAGARYMLPILDEGLLKNPSIQDRLAFEFGLDFLHRSYSESGWNYGWSELRPTVGALWTVWLNDRLAVYPKLDLGYEIGWITGWEDAWGTTPKYNQFYWEVLGGVMYKLGGVTLRAELGSVGLKAGVGFGF